ncbi:MAG: glycosyltransferase family 2 protein [Clostridiales bacterium]|nr:glycosyltransferase family 2 protein [Clostridiales bacterium]
MTNVVAIVVTYNRKELLQECLDALLLQTVPLSKVIVFNNCSTDGTEKLFAPGAKYYNTVCDLVNSDSNLGGAGGFSEGVRIASQYNFDWVWIMDDDTIPEPTALEELIKSAYFLKKNNETIGFLASYVYGPAGEPMNVPKIDTTITDNGYSFWYEYLDHGIVRISEATFVSILVPMQAIKHVGYPIAEYFIWGDDCEYTRRLVKYYGKAFFCGNSKVLHKRFNAKKITVLNEESKNRINIYQFYYRNMLLNTRKYGSRIQVLVRWLYYFALSIYCLIYPKGKYHVAKFCSIQKGIWMYLFRPLNLRKI